MSEWGWAGRVAEFLAYDSGRWLNDLDRHAQHLIGRPTSESQLRAWRDEHEVMTSALRAACTAEPELAPTWGIAFEYELPLEGGRRPDVVVLTGAEVRVIEFKGVRRPRVTDIDQVGGYVRDLSDYHQASHGREVTPLLVLIDAPDGYAEVIDGVTACSPDSLPNYLLAAADGDDIDLEAWLDSPYEPLPTLVEAARRIFRDEPLPHVKRAESAGIPETVELLGRLTDEAAVQGRRIMAFVTGVPGSGKTLVGLRLVYERIQQHGRATFLSGNGPLVDVLQDALGDKVFVRDLHAFIKTYALNKRRKDPTEHVVVFDEAQRAWDESYMETKRNVEASEPDLLVQIGERIDEWAALVGLVGEGQEIYSGEEGGMEQWARAVEPANASDEWMVYCPPKLAHLFRASTSHEQLDLTVSLRTKRADRLHEWVRMVLDGHLAHAARIAPQIPALEYPMYVTRDLEDAKRYVRDRYASEPTKRYGLIASSQAPNLAAYGIKNTFLDTRTLKIAPWFNAERDDPQSCCALETPATEFQCQGLELDFPIVCWGWDLDWNGTSWELRPKRRRYPLEDPETLLRNTYRVLLTRGREGLIVWLPPDHHMDQTEHALLAAGLRPLVVEPLAVAV